MTNFTFKTVDELKSEVASNERAIKLETGANVTLEIVATYLTLLLIPIIFHSLWILLIEVAVITSVCIWACRGVGLFGLVILGIWRLRFCWLSPTFWRKPKFDQGNIRSVLRLGILMKDEINRAVYQYTNWLSSHPSDRSAVKISTIRASYVAFSSLVDPLYSAPENVDGGNSAISLENTYKETTSLIAQVAGI